jgi:hypothetical protein
LGIGATVRWSVLGVLIWLWGVLKKIVGGNGGWRSEVGSRRSEVGGRRSEVGGWRLEVGGWRSEVGGRKSDFAIIYKACKNRAKVGWGL